jgi:hypothetical protein
MRGDQMDMNSSPRAMRAFASRVTALSVDQLAVWRRPLTVAAPPSSERSEQRWEGEGGSLGTTKKEKPYEGRRTRG